MEKKRSVGVTVVGVLFIIFPVSNIFLAGILGYYYTPLQYLFRGFFVLYPVITGIGILLLKEWARKLAIIFAILTTILAIFVCLAKSFINPEIFFKNVYDLIANISMIIIGSLLLYFFTRPKVKEQFK